MQWSLLAYRITKGLNRKSGSPSPDIGRRQQLQQKRQQIQQQDRNSSYNNDVSSTVQQQQHGQGESRTAGSWGQMPTGATWEALRQQGTAEQQELNIMSKNASRRQRSNR